VSASPWLFLCTGLLASFNGFGKRLHELTAEHKGTREVLESYSEGTLVKVLWTTGAATVLSFVAYTVDNPHPDLFPTHRLVWTVPLIALGMWRFMRIVSTR